MLSSAIRSIIGSVSVALLLARADAAIAEINCRSTQAAQFQIESGKAIALTVDLEEGIKDGATLFVHVKGALVGAVPSTFLVPLEQHGVPIEIGLPLLQEVPLYSFVVGSGELDRQELRVAVSQFGFGKVPSDNVWGSVTIKANAIANVGLTQVGKDLFSVSLPVNPYNSISDFWQVHKIEPRGKEWVSNIPPVNIERVSAGVDHVTFNKAAKTIEYTSRTAGSGPIEWSGSIAVAMKSSDPGAILTRRDWVVSSDPPGAEVRSLNGREGYTRVELQDVPRVDESFILVKKDGYFDCAQSDCDKNETDTRVELSCHLPKKEH